MTLPVGWAALPRREFGPPGPLRDRLVARILLGAKVATTSLDAPFNPVPRAGDRYVVPTSDGSPAGVIEYTSVHTYRLAHVPLEHCRADGRPDDTVASWRAAHEQVWTSDAFRAKIGDPEFVVGDDTLIHCVTFALVGRAGPLVAVLDYGSGNLHSVTRALAAAGAVVSLTSDPGICAAADGLVVPGVGAFGACMAGLAAVDGPRLVRERLAGGRPVLGICVGHQVMFAAGVEHGATADGVGVLPGVVEQLHAERLPHMGWNTVEAADGSTLFAGVEAERFYFVHSYAVRSADWPDGVRVTWAEHGGDRFVAAVEYGALSATQFHPEKSGDAGGRLLRNWVGSL